MGSKIFTEQENQSLLLNAIDIVHEAGKITIDYFKQNLIIENKDENFFNPVTVADKSAEKKIREMIEKLYPDDAIVGEEYGKKSGSTDFTWIIAFWVDFLESFSKTPPKKLTGKWLINYAHYWFTVSN